MVSSYMLKQGKLVSLEWCHVAFYIRDLKGPPPPGSCI